MKELDNQEEDNTSTHTTYNLCSFRPFSEQTLLVQDLSTDPTLVCGTAFAWLRRIIGEGTQARHEQDREYHYSNCYLLFFFTLTHIQQPLPLDYSTTTMDSIWNFNLLFIGMP